MIPFLRRKISKDSDNLNEDKDFDVYQYFEEQKMANDLSKKAKLKIIKKQQREKCKKNSGDMEISI